MIALGAEVAVEPGAGVKSGIPDAEFAAAGAERRARAPRADADVVLKVRRPAASELAGYKKGALVIAIMDPYGEDAALKAMADAGVTAFAMELLPRITRAQGMDVLSSQANLAGYRAVIDGAAEYGRALPMMMTAAGTVPAARVFVMGAGVAGLQAIATARRLGAIVTATDVRPAAKEQVESLGAKFIAVEDEEFRQAETAGGYAKEMSKDYQAKQAALVADHIKKQDIVITTALIPGRPAPRLISKDMVASMRPGSVIVDLAVERGGNCELAEPGEVADASGVKIVGHLNVARPHRRLRFESLRQEPVRLPRDAGRQEGEGACGQMGRRDRQGDGADPRWRRDPSEALRPRARLDELRRAGPGLKETDMLTLIAPGSSSAAAARRELTGARDRARPARHHRGGVRRCHAGCGRRRCRPVRVPALDLRAGGVRRLLRRVVGDAGPAHPADVGDQRDLVGDRGRRAARGRGSAAWPMIPGRSGRVRSASLPWCSPRSTSSAAFW